MTVLGSRAIMNSYFLSRNQDFMRSTWSMKSYELSLFQSTLEAINDR